MTKIEFIALCKTTPQYPECPYAYIEGNDRWMEGYDCVRCGKKDEIYPGGIRYCAGRQEEGNCPF